MKKIEILLQEKNNLREEILSNNKTIYGSLFTSITLIGILLGYLIGKNGIDDFLKNKDYLLCGFIVSQIEFIISIFIFSLNSSIVSIGVYLKTIDERINIMKKEKLLFWEAESMSFRNSNRDVEYYCLLIIYAFFILIFLFSMILNFIDFLPKRNCFDFKIIMPLLQIIEAFLIIFLIRKKSKEVEVFQDHYSKSLKKDKKNQNDGEN